MYIYIYIYLYIYICIYIYIYVYIYVYIYIWFEAPNQTRSPPQHPISIQLNPHVLNIAGAIFVKAKPLEKWSTPFGSNSTVKRDWKQLLFYTQTQSCGVMRQETKGAWRWRRPASNHCCCRCFMVLGRGLVGTLSKGKSSLTFCNLLFTVLASKARFVDGIGTR